MQQWAKRKKKKMKITYCGLKHHKQRRKRRKRRRLSASWRFFVLLMKLESMLFSGFFCFSVFRSFVCLFFVSLFLHSVFFHHPLISQSASAENPYPHTSSIIQSEWSPPPPPRFAGPPPCLRATAGFTRVATAWTSQRTSAITPTASSASA